MPPLCHPILSIRTLLNMLLLITVLSGCDYFRDPDIDGDGVTASSDCDDSDPNVSPEQQEIPFDELDNDCNPDTLDRDQDQDGYASDNDCNDQDANVNPAMSEIFHDTLDNDCNPDTLDNPDDMDQDGYDVPEDCNDASALVHPDADETPYDGVDNDCSDETPDDDLDQDGYLREEDCDDSNSSMHPGAIEECDAEDNNCNGTIDDVNPEDQQIWYQDLDNDGYGSLNEYAYSCTRPSGYADNSDDCNDNQESANPGRSEATYDGIDNDCNPTTPDDDLDGDGYLLANDCNDQDASINPDSGYNPDPNEPNNYDPVATDLGTLNGSVTSYTYSLSDPGDADWYFYYTIDDIDDYFHMDATLETLDGQSLVLAIYRLENDESLTLLNATPATSEASPITTFEQGGSYLGSDTGYYYLKLYAVDPDANFSCSQYKFAMTVD